MVYLASAFSCNEPKQYVPCTVGQKRAGMAEPKTEPHFPRGQPRASLILDDEKHPSRVNSCAKGEEPQPWKKDIPWEKWRKSRKEKKGICAFNPAWLSPTMDRRWGGPGDMAHPRLITLTPVRALNEPPQKWRHAPKTIFCFHSTSTRLVCTQQQQSEE